MKDERKKCRVVSCEIFEKKEKNLKTHECLCVFLVVQVCKKIVSLMTKKDRIKLVIINEIHENQGCANEKVDLKMRIYVLHTSMVFIWSISLEFLACSNQLFFFQIFLKAP